MKRQNKLTREQVRQYANEASAMLIMLTGSKPKDEWIEHEIERMYQLGVDKYGKAEKDAGNRYFQDNYKDKFTDNIKKLNDIL